MYLSIYLWKTIYESVSTYKNVKMYYIKCNVICAIPTDCLRTVQGERESPGLRLLAKFATPPGANTFGMLKKEVCLDKNDDTDVL